MSNGQDDYRWLADQVIATMSDPDAWDRDAAEPQILADYVHHLAAGRAAAVREMIPIVTEMLADDCHTSDVIAALRRHSESPYVARGEHGGSPLRVRYRNWRGVTGERTLIPLFTWHGATSWHSRGWMLRAWDVEKDAVRDYALTGFLGGSEGGDDVKMCTSHAPCPRCGRLTLTKPSVVGAGWYCPGCGADGNTGVCRPSSEPPVPGDAFYRDLAADLTDPRFQAELTASMAQVTAVGGPHVYLSTGCLHGNHGYCQGKTGAVGAKVPGKCKFCDARCVCECHQGEPCDDGTPCAGTGCSHDRALGDLVTLTEELGLYEDEQPVPQPEASESCQVLVSVNGEGRLKATCSCHGLLVSASTDEEERAVNDVAVQHLRENPITLDLGRRERYAAAMAGFTGHVHDVDGPTPERWHAVARVVMEVADEELRACEDRFTAETEALRDELVAARNETLREVARLAKNEGRENCLIEEIALGAFASRLHSMITETPQVQPNVTPEVTT